MTNLIELHDQDKLYILQYAGCAITAYTTYSGVYKALTDVREWDKRNANKWQVTIVPLLIRE